MSRLSRKLWSVWTRQSDGQTEPRRTALPSDEKCVLCVLLRGIKRSLRVKHLSSYHVLSSWTGSRSEVSPGGRKDSTMFCPNDETTFTFSSESLYVHVCTFYSWGQTFNVCFTSQVKNTFLSCCQATNRKPLKYCSSLHTVLLLFWNDDVVSLSTGKDLLLVSWRAADEDAEDAHPSSHHVQVGRRPVRHLEAKYTLIEIKNKTSGKDPQRQTKEEIFNDWADSSHWELHVGAVTTRWVLLGSAHTAAGLMLELLVHTVSSELTSVNVSCAVKPVITINMNRTHESDDLSGEDDVQEVWNIGTLIFLPPINTLMLRLIID